LYDVTAWVEAEVKSPQLRLLSPNYVGYPSRLPAYKSIVLALRKRILVVVGILLVVTASIIVIAWDASLSFCDYPFGATPSVTVSESKARGVWVVSLRAVPAKLTLPAKTVHIDAAWVEARSHRTERIWGFSERRLDGYSLCLHCSKVGSDTPIISFQMMMVQVSVR
jgi:hypothetical protein